MNVYPKLVIITSIIVNTFLFSYFHIVHINKENLVKKGVTNLNDLESAEKAQKLLEKKKLAVLVPYRNSLKELGKFAPHMKKFLGIQKVPYHVFVIHQTDALRFNRGALINIGYLYARDKFGK